ncbi:MAG: hypothetical protein GEU74_03035 [Nitriliruptorales bacterium]|nr:hypothetical protein [Nitriliruptorales bacterium]
MATKHLLGLLLGTEEDWSGAFEALLSRARLDIVEHGDRHQFESERITIEPFNLRAHPRYDLVIDRLAHWYFVPREWLKKIALMNDVYLLNNPFTFQAMEKHAAYCAMMRLGFKIPDTWLIPHKNPPHNERFAYTAERYNQPFDLEQVAQTIGYPLYMKPFDGGAWVGVTRIADRDALQKAYNESGERLMHLQAAVDGFDVFARSLSIGAETMVMRFDPDRPQHDRYQVDHGFLKPSVGDEVVTIGRTVNAFFRWEFNSCETLVKGNQVYPIDYANACPDVSLISLHYYFPWAVKALLKWSVFCAVSGRRMPINLDLLSWFTVGDSDMTYDERLGEYRRLADDYFQRDDYEEFCVRHLGAIDEVMLEYVRSNEFDRLLVRVVHATFPVHEHEQFVEHYRGLLKAWADGR